MEGIEEASVSLNDAMATIRFAPDNEVTIQSIRKKVRESGFNPKETALVLEGELQSEGDRLVLQVKPSGRYPLNGAPDKEEKWETLKQVEEGKTVRIFGQLPEHLPDPLRIPVVDFQVAPFDQEKELLKDWDWEASKAS